MTGPVRILLSGITIISITLVLGEIALRMVSDEYDPEKKLMFKMSTQGYQLGPSGYAGRHTKNSGDFDVSVEINSDGFRDSKSLVDSSMDDWFLVGDSFSFGFGVEPHSRFSNLLEKQLGIAIYNISIPNNLDGYYFLLDHARQEGAKVGRLMVGVCMENDLALYSKPIQVDSDHVFKEIQPSWNLAGIKYFLSSNSATYMALTRLVHHTPWLKKLAVDRGFIIENLDGIPITGYSEKLVKSSADRLLGIAELQGISEMIIILIPSRGLWIENLRNQHQKIHNAFVESLKARKLEFIDLRTKFENAGDPLRFHFTNDGHWNEAGHVLAASIIAKHLDTR